MRLDFDFLLVLVLLLLVAMKQDPTNGKARMTNDELRLIARRRRSCRGDLEIVRWVQRVEK